MSHDFDAPLRESAQDQAKILAHALPFLRRYAGATIVVKYGGHAMGEEALAHQFGRDNEHEAKPEAAAQRRNPGRHDSRPDDAQHDADIGETEHAPEPRPI